MSFDAFSNILDQIDAKIDLNTKPLLTGKRFYSLVMDAPDNKYNKIVCNANGEKMFIECLSEHADIYTLELIKLMKEYGIYNGKILDGFDDKDFEKVQFYVAAPVLSAMNPDSQIMKLLLSVLFTLYKKDDNKAKAALQTLLALQFPKIFKIIKKYKKVSADELLSAADVLNMRNSDEEFDAHCFSEFIPYFIITFYMCKIYDVEFDESADGLYSQIGSMISSAIKTDHCRYDVYKNYKDLNIAEENVYEIKSDVYNEFGFFDDISKITDIDDTFIDLTKYEGHSMDVIKYLMPLYEENVLPFTKSSRHPARLKKLGNIVREMFQETMSRYGFSPHVTESYIRGDFVVAKIHAGYRLAKALTECGIDPDIDMDQALFLSLSDIMGTLGYTLKTVRDYASLFVNIMTDPDLTDSDLGVNRECYERLEKIFLGKSGAAKTSDEDVEIDSDGISETVRDLQKENEKLSQKLHECEKKNETLSSEIKRVRGELDHYKKIYEQKKTEHDNYVSEYKIAQEEHEELIRFRDYVYNLTEHDVDNSNGVTKEDMIEALRDKNIVIIGGHQNWTSKLKELFPKWKYIRPNSKMSVETMKTDYVFFFTDCLKHSTYYKNVAYLGEHGLPFGFIHSINIDNNIRQIYKDVVGNN